MDNRERKLQTSKMPKQQDPSRGARDIDFDLQSPYPIPFPASHLSGIIFPLSPLLLHSYLPRQPQDSFLGQPFLHPERFNDRFHLLHHQQHLQAP